MNKIKIIILKTFKKIYNKKFGVKKFELPLSDQDPDSISQKIYNILIADKPCMIARFGAFELETLVNYIGVNSPDKSCIEFIKDNHKQWWWNERLIKYMNTNAGFFPPTIEKIEQFCELMINDIPQVDILGSWLVNEHFFNFELKKATKIKFIYLDPFWSTLPWTRALEGKKVLVVHPFTNSIEKQYKKRHLLFNNNLLPEFELKTIKSVQSIAGIQTPFSDWFEALDSMKNKIDKIDYDICLIGAGAYGFPLAAHVKRMGKKSVHMGGSLQLLFGIKGKRWEKRDYRSRSKMNYPSLFNEHWVRAGKDETPKKSIEVEDACYW